MQTQLLGVILIVFHTFGRADTHTNVILFALAGCLQVL